MEPSGVYTGPPAWTLGRVFTSWQADPVVLAILLLAGAGYVWGLVRLRRRGVHWGPSRTLAFATGLLLWFFTVCSGLGVYERVLFTDRAVQAVVLLMVVPLLLALGAPVSLLVEASTERTAERIRAALGGRVSMVLMFPLVSTLLLVLPPWLLYFTSWYERSLTSPVFNTLFHVGLVLFGLAYFWPRLQIDPVAREYHPLIGVVITIVEVLGDAALGFILVFGSRLLVPDYWHQLARPWGMSPEMDQKWGGGVLWGLGDIAGLPFLAALIRRLITVERKRTVEVDRELDEAAVIAAAEAAAAGVVPRPAEDDEPARPWWETDPRFAHRYGRETS